MFSKLSKKLPIMIQTTYSFQIRFPSLIALVLLALIFSKKDIFSHSRLCLQHVMNPLFKLHYLRKQSLLYLATC